MNIRIDHAEAERLLAEIAARRAQDEEKVLLDLLRTEHERLEALSRTRLHEVRAATRKLQDGLAAAEVIDARRPDEIVAYDEHGLPR